MPGPPQPGAAGRSVEHGRRLASFVQELLRAALLAASWGREPRALGARLSLGVSVPGQHGREGHGHVVGSSKRFLGRPEGILRPACHAAPRPARRAHPTPAVAPPGAVP